tara:strand:- start:104 stop:223 length:120 start_codon:yes stop_codon:yes gene_type:complete
VTKTGGESQDEETKKTKKEQPKIEEYEAEHFFVQRIRTY